MVTDCSIVQQLLHVLQSNIIQLKKCFFLNKVEIMNNFLMALVV